MKVPRYGEIWWCFPKGTSLEPNHAVIYNVRENTWYDTPLPNGGRGAGIFPTVFNKPIMTGVEPQNAIGVDVAVAAGGTGYTAGNTLLVAGGDGAIPTELTVTTVSSGVITGVQVSNTGRYRTPPANPVSVTGGSGAGATFNVDFVEPYQTWVHETGTDEVDGQIARPIRSYFETADISLPPTGVNRATQVVLLEPDFAQSGDMTVQITGRANARSPRIEGAAVLFPAVAATPDQQVVRLKEQRRQLRFRFESNVPGGDYQMGLVLAHVQPGDGTLLG